MTNLGWILWLSAFVVLEALSVVHRKKTLSRFVWETTRRRFVWFGLATLLIWASLHLLRLFGFENIP